MAKQQKCGTCRFFQEAGLAGSGWCHHPERKTSSDVMIMVRRSELACRDDWSRSLWQSAHAGPDDNEQRFTRSPLTGPVPPTSQEDLTTLLAQEIVSSPTSGEDVLLSEARIISEPAEARNRWETPARAVQMPNFDPRTAIFRAREAYRDKIRAKATEARMLSSAEPISEPHRDSAQTEGEEPDLTLDYAPSEAVTSAPRSMPDVRPVCESAQPAVFPLGLTVTATAAPLDVEKSGGGRHHMAPGKALPTLKRGAEPQSLEPDGGALQDKLPPPAPRIQSPQAGVALPIGADLPGWYRTDLPRVCRTCRDYRPSADGMRGWCANSWAFTHRRLVQSDDSAPCHSAIGDWWAPVDDVWLVAADVSSHGRATPHLDRLTGQETVRRRRS